VSGNLQSYEHYLIYLNDRPREVKDDVVNNSAGGEQNLASLSRVEGAGHLVSH
jgi:hypothetical protein